MVSMYMWNGDGFSICKEAGSGLMANLAGRLMYAGSTPLRRGYHFFMVEGWMDVLGRSGGE